MYVYWECHKTHWVDMPVGVLFKWVLYLALLYLLVDLNLEINLKKEQVASNEKNAFMLLSPNFGKSIPTTAYQTLLFVPDNIKLGRACSRDVNSVLRTTSWDNFMFYDGLCYSREPLIVTLVHTPLILPCGLCYNYTYVQAVCTRCSFLPLFCAWEWGFAIHTKILILFLQVQVHT